MGFVHSCCIPPCFWKAFVLSRSSKPCSVLSALACQFISVFNSIVLEIPQSLNKYESVFFWYFFSSFFLWNLFFKCSFERFFWFPLWFSKDSSQQIKSLRYFSLLLQHLVTPMHVLDDTPYVVYCNWVPCKHLQNSPLSSCKSLKQKAGAEVQHLEPVVLIVLC